MIRLTIGKEEFIITTNQNGYNIKSLTTTNSFDARQGELNETIYRLIERLEVWGVILALVKWIIVWTNHKREKFCGFLK